MNPQPKNHSHPILAGAITALLAAHSASATTYYWNTTTTGAWTDGANWSDDATSGGTTGTAPVNDITSDDVVFNQSSVNGATISQLSAATLIKGVTFANTGTTAINTNGTANRSLTLGAGGITINPGAGAVTFGTTTNNQQLNFILGAAQTWTNNSSTALNLNNKNTIDNGGFLLVIDGTGDAKVTGGVISGDGGLTKSGSGTLSLGSAANTYAGTTTLNAGVLSLGNNASLGPGNFTINGGTVNVTSNRTTTNTQTWNGDWTYGGGGSWNTGTSAVTLAAAAIQLTNSSNAALTVGGAATGTSNLTIKANGNASGTITFTDINNTGTITNSGSGHATTTLTSVGSNVTALTQNSTTSILNLTGANSYTGATTITGGTLALSGTGSIADSSLIEINSSATLSVTGLSASTFTVGSAQTLAGGGTILATGKTVVANGTLAPGSSPGTLTQNGGSLQLGVGGDLNWQVHNASAAAGTGYDTVNLINGADLDLSLLGAGNTYNINLWSLSEISPDAHGNATNFNNTLNYSWTLFSTGTAIDEFSTDKFTINTGAFNGTNGFSNALGGGSFSIGLGDSNTDLVLNFTAVPEPSVAAMLGALGLLALLRRRP